jgi:dipeptidyl aminopeptidase/acylaminoacyl peptidase
MKLKLVLVAVVVAAIGRLPALIGAQGADVKADYDRANSLRDRVLNKVYDVATAPTWIPGTPRFWYQKSVKGGNQFVLVDPSVPSKAPAFDHARLATALSTAASASYTAVTLPFSTFTYVDSGQAIEFTIGGTGRGGAAGRGGAGGRAGGAANQPAPPKWHCTLTDYQCTRSTSTSAPETQAGGRSGAPGRAGGACGAVPTDAPQGRVSPDGKTEAFVENFNIFVRPVSSTSGRGAGEPTALSWDGSEGNCYTFSSIAWSPDSQKIAAYRRVPGYQRMVSYVQSSPSDQLQPKASSRFYAKPGDVVDFDQPVLFHVDTKQHVVVDKSLFPNPYDNSRVLAWRKDSRAFTFEYNQRGHQVYRVIEVDGTTGQARAVIEETSKTFIDYRTANGGLSDSGRTYRYDVADGKEVIWMSERDGWAHLYLYDGETGRVKNQITTGNWLVRSVDRVDPDTRQIWFTASGMDPGKDPYYLHYYRINFDGTGLTAFTEADGYHAVSWSPDRRYYVDTYSRVDLPPVSELRRTADQQLVLPLEKGDMTDLLATGWKPPEVFVSKGRDGTTDIWGVMVRPTNFDPAKKYPVIENIYAGPQGSFVPKTWSTQTGMQTMAELGFIVVQIDGMGTANRSKAFHDVAWRNLGDAGFPDRILWHKAVAAKYPGYDITRVGIYGTSAGGQNAMGAVLFHPEFYKAAAAASGCHDNRMDKIWWNEQWMGWPIGPEYAASSNMEHANNLQGDLLLIFGEMDTNVDPSSTLQVVNKLILANKSFELLEIPNSDHTSGGAYGDHKRFDFFVHHLRGLEPPSWNATPVNAGAGVLDTETRDWVASEDTGFSQG